jgi:hypothetical protein
MEETRGEPHREMSAQEVLDIVLNHPEVKEEVKEETPIFANTSA